ncbi:hypothetical protein ON010_g14836 [Phytophthora cinnamomi]|nr:hypothetical protein ON010_g14836 [Phytophthora cinnamomi]
MTKQEKFFDEQKLDAVTLWELQGWNTTEASKTLGVCRSTLLGWRAAKGQIDERVRIGTKIRPEPKPSTQAYEGDLVNTIKLSSDIDAKMTRGAIIGYCKYKISGFKERSSGAQSSWLNRFIKRHELREYLVAYDFSAQPRNKKIKFHVSMRRKTVFAFGASLGAARHFLN